MLPTMSVRLKTIALLCEVLRYLDVACIHTGVAVSRPKCSVDPNLKFEIQFQGHFQVIYTWNVGKLCLFMFPLLLLVPLVSCEALMWVKFIKIVSCLLKISSLDFHM